MRARLRGRRFLTWAGLGLAAAIAAVAVLRHDRAASPLPLDDTTESPSIPAAPPPRADLPRSIDEKAGGLTREERRKRLRVELSKLAHSTSTGKTQGAREADAHDETEVEKCGFFPPELRKPARDFSAYPEKGGKAVLLTSYFGRRPIALVFGSYT